MVFAGMVGTLIGSAVSLISVGVSLATYLEIKKTGTIWSSFMLLVVEISILIFLSAFIGFVENTIGFGYLHILWISNILVYALIAFVAYRFYRGAFRIFSELLGVKI